MNPVALSCLLFFTIIIENVSSLSCNHCYSESSWADCDTQSKVLECTHLAVHDLHLKLLDFNPKLPINTTAFDYVDYRCYELELQLSFVTGPSDRLLERGCTFSRAQLCKNWDPNLVRSVNCSLSEIGVPGIDDSAVDEDDSSESAGSLGMVRNVGSLVWMVIGGLFTVKALMY